MVEFRPAKGHVCFVQIGKILKTLSLPNLPNVSFPKC